jgi:quinol monooxygenase YgiN
MKKFLFIIAGIFTLLTACCEPKTQEANADECCVANKDSYEIVMNIPVKIKPEHVSAYKAAFDKCQAESLKEEACQAYELFQSYKDSTEFHLFEKWTNNPGLQNHMQTEHVKLFFKEIEGMQVAAKTKMLTTTVCPKIN